MSGAVAVEARGLSLEGPYGWVYRDVTFTAEKGTLTAIAGEGGTGRTSLALTLAGRMKPDKGDLKVFGETTPKGIQQLAALGVLHDVNDLEPALTVGEHGRERLAPQGWMLGRTARARMHEALEAAGLDVDP